MGKHAFVLVTCVPGEENKTENLLNKIPQIRNSNIVKGAFDIVIRIKTSSMHEFRELMSNIRRLPTVRATLTLDVHE